MRIEAIGVASFDAGGLIRKWQRVSPSRQTIRQAFGVFVRLGFDTGKGYAFFLGFDYPGGFAIDIQQVIGKPISGQWKFADRDTARGMDIGFVCVAHMPTRLREQVINVLPGF